MKAPVPDRQARRAPPLRLVQLGGNIVEITVKGMSCGHCAAAVTKALEALPGVSQVKVDLTNGRVTFAAANPLPQEELAKVIKAAGYELVPA